MIKIMQKVLFLALLVNSSLLFAQEEVETKEENTETEEVVQNEDIIKTEILLGNQFLKGHGAGHLVLNANGETNVFYNKYGHFQILPFRAFIFTHYTNLEHIQIKNIKVTTVNFIMDQYHLGLGGPAYGQQQLAYGEHNVPVKTFTPVTISGFHKVNFNDGKAVLEISGYISAPGYASGFGENSRYELDVDGNHNGGTYIPAGASIGLNFNNKVQLSGFANYQNFRSNDKSSGTKDIISFNEIHYGLKANVDVGQALNTKLRGINLYASATNQNLQFNHKVDNQSSVLMKQNWFEFQVGAGYTFQKKAKKKLPTGPF